MRQRSGRRGFTLVELMTVIAIIVLLIGVLIPALASARDQAHKAATSSQLNAIEKGCQLFRNDNDALPVSHGGNPFEASSWDASNRRPAAEPPVPLSGAQWLALQLVGADRIGYVKPVVGNDALPADNWINQRDWLDWYEPDPASQSREYKRVGPYVPVDGKILGTPHQFFIEQRMATPPDELLVGAEDSGAGGDSDWNNGQIPFFLDGFGYPILYYAATPGAKEPITTGTPGSNLLLGRYDSADNGPITGSQPGPSGSDNGRYPIPQTDGWDLVGRGTLPNRLIVHPMGAIGYEPRQTTWPDPGTFAANICDRNIFDSTSHGGTNGRLWPNKPDGFLLISAGKDGLYGTIDDLRNYQQGQ